jgi:hypothetical protein
VLEDVRDALAVADWTLALGLSVDAWRMTRAPAIADLVDAIAARCAKPKVPKRRKSVHRWWMGLAEAHDPADLAALLATLMVGVEVRSGSLEAMRARWVGRGNPVMDLVLSAGPNRYSRDLFERIAAILEWPDDPRVAVALTQILRDPPYRAVEDFGPTLLVPIAARIGSLGDHRVIPTLWQCTDAQAKLATRAREGIEGHLVRDPGELVADCARLAAVPPKLERAQPDLDALWLEVAANPDDVGTRSVLGVALVVSGDLRGDLIVHQCNARVAGRPLRGATRDRYDGRVRTLMRLEWKRWFGDLAEVIVRRGSEFRCGMLEVARIGTPQTPYAHWASARGHRELVAVHTVLANWVTPAQFAGFVVALPRDPRMIAIDSPQMFDELAKLRPYYDIRSIECHVASRPPPNDAPGEGWGRVRGRPLIKTFEAAARLVPDLTELYFGLVPITVELSELVYELPRMFPSLARIRVVAEGDWGALDRIKRHPLAQMVSRT